MFNWKRNNNSDEGVVESTEDQPLDNPVDVPVADVTEQASSAEVFDEQELPEPDTGAAATSARQFKPKPSPLNLKPSIISEGFEFVGEIRSGGYLTIDGVVRGTLALQSVQIGANGFVDAQVTCDSMSVKGHFSGKLVCRDLTVGSRAVVDGEISFNSIAIQRGGIVKGELKKIGTEI